MRAQYTRSPQQYIYYVLYSALFAHELKLRLCLNEQTHTHMHAVTPPTSNNTSVRLHIKRLLRQSNAERLTITITKYVKRTSNKPLSSAPHTRRMNQIKSVVQMQFPLFRFDMEVTAHIHTYIQHVGVYVHTLGHRVAWVT